jgi:hypothetical protein
LQLAKGSQLKAGGVPPQVQRFVRGEERARARAEVVRRMARESFMLGKRCGDWGDGIEEDATANQTDSVRPNYMYLLRKICTIYSSSSTSYVVQTATAQPHVAVYHVHVRRCVWRCRWRFAGLETTGRIC